MMVQWWREKLVVLVLLVSFGCCRGSSCRYGRDGRGLGRGRRVGGSTFFKHCFFDFINNCDCVLFYYDFSIFIATILGGCQVILNFNSLTVYFNGGLYLNKTTVHGTTKASKHHRRLRFSLHPKNDHVIWYGILQCNTYKV